MPIIEDFAVTDIALHFAPNSCSRVSLIALLETGADFEPVLMRFMRGDHKSADYRRLNPKSKVPLLVVDGEPLTENVAILSYLDRTFPEAGLLPPAATPMEEARRIADLCFCSATLHPLVTRLRMPRMVAGPEAAQAVWDKACTLMRDHFQLVEDRLADDDWWYGDTWSIMDAYLAWAFWRVEGAGFPVADYPRFADHNRRMAARPSYQRAMEIEAAGNATLEAEGMTVQPVPTSST